METSGSSDAARRWRRRALIAAFTALLTAGIVYLGQRQLRPPAPPAAGSPSAEAESGMRLERIHQTATREGRTEWELDAEQARYMPTEKKIRLSVVKVLYYLKDGRTVNLTADEGWVYSDTNNLEASGNVVVQNDLYRLETQAIDYDHAARRITSRTPVVIRSRSAEITADTLLFELRENRLTLDGRVRLTASGGAAAGRSP